MKTLVMEATLLPSVDNRETWLNKAAALLRPMLEEVGHSAAEQLRITVGWPSTAALSTNPEKRRIGECWYPENSGDNTCEIFISPSVDDSVKILAVLLHEMIHSGFSAGVGHKGSFRTVFYALGFTGSAKHSTPGEALFSRLARLHRKLGDIPHAALSGRSTVKKQTTRLLKVECSNSGYVARITRKWLEDEGAPICPCCHEVMVEG